MARAKRKITTLRLALAALKAAGTAQNRKIYRRHGVTAVLFGVSFADMKSIAQQVGTNHALAEALFATGNHDARVLALRVADPERLRRTEAEAWLRQTDNYILSNALGGLVARARFADAASAKWRRARREWTKHCGYDVLSTRLKEGHRYAKAELAQVLEDIEAQIHRAPGRARHAMNNTVIAIGVYGPGLRRTAVATARRIGPVEVDHGATDCKTPDAVAYIEKTMAYRARKAKAAR